MKRFVLTVQRRLIAALAILGLVAIGSLMSATPAQAALSDCDKGRFCIFQNGNGSGMYGSFAKGTHNLGSKKVLGGKMNDRTSYIWNRSGKPWCIYQNKNLGGHGLMVAAGVKRPMNFKVNGFKWNDKVSSLRPATYINPPRNPGAAHYICQGNPPVLTK